jgi:hypothetical protein
MEIKKIKHAEKIKAANAKKMLTESRLGIIHFAPFLAPSWCGGCGSRPAAG